MQPYIYLLFSRTLKMYYVGVKYARDSDPKKFWKTYFTSSKIVHKLIDLYGVDDFKFRIVKVYDSSEEAILIEHKYTLKAIKKKNYLNCGAGIAVRLDKCSLAGKLGGSKQKFLKIGIHKQTREERLKLSSKGGKKGCLMNGWKDSKQQSERGKKGGPKNKGFLWYNDGINVYKYTKHQQEKMMFCEFLKENKNFTKGIIRTPTKGRIWVNNGIKNMMVINPSSFNLGRIREKYGKNFIN